MEIRVFPQQAAAAAGESFMEYVFYHTTPLGTLHIAHTEEALTQIRCTGAARTPTKPVHALGMRIAQELDEYFAGARKNFSIAANPPGTVFQRRVWEALLQIPYGETCSYTDIARRCGNARACRAVGMANNKNPIAIVIPCHRVIAADGSLCGYAGGLENKAFLLRLEAGVVKQERNGG